MFLEKKACISAYVQVSSQRCYWVRMYVCAHVHVEIWVLTQIHVPGKESLYFCIWTCFLSAMLLCTRASLCTCVQKIWVLSKIHVPGKESLYFSIWTSFLSAMLLCTLICLCTCAWRNLSAYQNWSSWKRKLVLVHMDKFPLSNVTVCTRMFVHMCTKIFKCFPKFMFLEKKASSSSYHFL